MAGSAAGGLDGGRTLRQARWRLRRLLAERRHGRAALASAPILFGNSFPKSGTHLLAQVLVAFPRLGVAVDRGLGPILTFARATGGRRSAQEIRSELDQLQPGDVAFGHVVADPHLVAPLTRAGVAHFFMLRDPRDVAVSHAHYIGDRAVHNVHHAYYQSLPDLEARLRASIQGRPDFAGQFPDLGTRFGLYLGWLDQPEVKVLHFEDFVTGRRQALAALLAHAEDMGFQRTVSEDRALELLAQAIDPGKSYTYRRGAVGDWQAHFTPPIKALFKDVAGDLLVRLGYEKDLDW